MEDKERYKHLNKYLKEKFGERTLKICIDGGFTCPNRDGTISTKGCIFCSEKGSGELIRCGFGNTITEKLVIKLKIILIVIVVNVLISLLLIFKILQTHMILWIC